MGKRVQKMPDLPSLIQKGESFRYACQIIQSHTPGRVIAGFALVTNNAFAAEAYLKCLTMIERKLKPLQTHNLMHLFRDLSSEAQQQLGERFERELLPSLQYQFNDPNLPAGLSGPSSFDVALQRSAFAFVDWRYADRSDKPMHYHLLGMPDLARERIYRLRPDLKRYPNVTMASR